MNLPSSLWPSGIPSHLAAALLLFSTGNTNNEKHRAAYLDRTRDPREPGPVEKFLFYDHPSGRDRVETSMRWFKENQALFEAEGE